MSDIDELLIEAKRVCGERWQKAPEYPWGVAAQFGAEVERLRAERDKFEQQMLGARDAHRKLLEEYRKQAAHDAEQREKLAVLEAENAELRDQLDRYKSVLGDLDESKPSEGT